MEMILFNSNFEVRQDGEQPYSIIPEATHKYSGYDGRIDHGVFFIARSYTKQLLLMPGTTDFAMEAKLSYREAAADGYYYEPVWCIHFGYDKMSRSGYQLKIRYSRSTNEIEIVLLRNEGVRKSELGRQMLHDISLQPEVPVGLALKCESGHITTTLCDDTVSFDVEKVRGVIALSKEGYACEPGFSDIIITGDEAPESKVWESTFRIPRTDGGVLDYSLTLSAAKFDGNDDLYRIDYELNGGAYENHTDLRGTDCWVWEYDVFNGLYFSFGGEKYYLSNDRLVFVDNDYPYLKGLLGGRDIPYRGNFMAQGKRSAENVFIGYDRRFSLCAGNLVSDRMYTYDMSGELLFIGKALTEDCFFDVRSAPDKEITRRIPESNPDYADALFHAQRNHYFMKGETQALSFDIYSKVDIRYLSVSAELENTWFEKLRELTPSRGTDSDNIFAGYGYKKYSFAVDCGLLEQSVYHVKFSCRYGNGRVYEHTSAFEVIDDSLNEAPSETAGIPQIYCGDGFSTKYSTYDLASVRPDFNITHYINGALHIPYFAEKRRTWELLDIYHRKSIIWMTRRGVREGETFRDYLEITKHADYIDYIDPGLEGCRYYYRYETGTCDNFDSKKVRELYHAFLSENPDIAGVFPPIENDQIDPGKWAMIPLREYDRWVTYINEKVRPWFVDQWKEIQAVNPRVRRFSYGPYPTYFSNHAGAYSTKWRGFSDDGLDEVFSGGFMKLEDYPFVCGYQTHSCSWSMSTIKLTWKDLCIAPDLYDSFGADCPDGAVGFAHPPMGESYAPPYQTVTQLYEYLYNTAIFDKDGFRFWDDNFINIYDHISYEPEKRFEVFLKSWKIFLDNKPERTLGTLAYITDFSVDEDRRPNEVDDLSIYNRNQTAMSVIHEVNAEMGVPQGFVMKWDSFEALDPADAKILILPSLCNVSDKTREKIRKMYTEGCALIATGTVDGLEDIFKVTPAPRKSRTEMLRYREKTEYVCPYTAEYFYESDGAETVVSSEEDSVILRSGRSMLLNVSLGEVGIDTLISRCEVPFAERANISVLIRDALRDFISENASPIMSTDEKCGLCAIRTVGGEIVVVLTDYSPFSARDAREVTVRFDGIKVKSVENLAYDPHDIDLTAFENGVVIDSFSVILRPHETLVFRIGTF